ncbi:MAG: methyltransferase domain-containing protein [Methanomicrobiales archaeon]|nr:methyltransferase domain-containing protein [Methanomicrobiales archaeon]
MNVRIVPRNCIPQILSESWVDSTRKPYISNDIAYIPVLDGYLYTTVLPERKRKGRGYQKIGDIIAFHGKKPGNELIQELIHRHSPKGIIWYKGHKSPMRIPDFELLYGEIGEVIQQEMGISYRLDPTRVMFSQGNRDEKKRVSELVDPGEQVCDMFAGIGYFTLPLARAGAEVHAIELNPESIHYLKINCRENGLSSKVTISAGDCRDHMKGTYDRIHMGHYDAIHFLPDALHHVHSGTMLHIHGIGDITIQIEDILSGLNVKAVYAHHVVKKIGPGKVHTVTDVMIS